MSILDLTYRLFNRTTEATTTRLGAWIDWMSDSSESNFRKTKDNFIKLEAEAISSRLYITGDGVRKEFSLEHKRNNPMPQIMIFDEATGTQMYPDIKLKNNNEVVITFLFPLENGARCKISVH